MFYTAIWNILPQNAKAVVAFAGTAVFGLAAAGDENLFPKYFGLDQYNRTVIEQVKADNDAAYIAEVKAEASALVPCGDSVSACEMLEESPELYAQLTADGTPVTKAKIQAMLKERGF